jgi:hypothetical protein
MFTICVSHVGNKTDNKDPGDSLAGLEGSAYVYAYDQLYFPFKFKLYKLRAAWHVMQVLQCMPDSTMY